MSTEWAEIRSGRVAFEDEAVLVLNKPAGISVTGERHDSDLVRMASAAGEVLFPVHRIDKVTSGAILLARELRWHGDLTRQFGKRTAGKAYLAVVRSPGLPARGRIDLPLSTGRKNRVRIAAPRAAIVADEASGTWSVPPSEAFAKVRTYPSVTTFATVWQDGRHALLVVVPVTGRRHQIRVHLAWIGHPVEGDPLFPPPAGGGPSAGAHGPGATSPGATSPGATSGPGRAALHSWRLAFGAAWRGGTRIEVEAPPGTDFWAPLAGTVPGDDPGAALVTARALATGTPGS